MKRYSMSYLVWYFGMPCDLAHALKIRVRDMAGWNEVPEKYRPQIDHIMELDAFEEIKK